MTHVHSHALATDEALFSAYVQGDSAAFDHLFERWAPRIARLISQRVGRHTETQELVQQTFLQLHHSRCDFREGASFRPWVVTIALNVRRNHTRTQRPGREVALQVNTHSQPARAERALEQNDTNHRVQKALNRLKPGQREVIELHWFSGMSFAEIGHTLGASRSAVKVRAHRGYETLRRVLTVPTDQMARCAA